MTSRLVQPAQIASNRQRGHDIPNPGVSSGTVVGRAAAAGHMDDGVDVSRGVKRRHANDTDEATDQTVSEHLKKQRQTVAAHLPAHMRYGGGGGLDADADAAALEEQEDGGTHGRRRRGREDDDDDDEDGGADAGSGDGGGGGAGLTNTSSTEITTTALTLGNRAHSAYCRLCLRGNRRDAPKSGPLHDIVETIKTCYDGKNLDVITDAVFIYSKRVWKKQTLWTRESIRFHIEYVYTGLQATTEKCLARVNAVIGLFDKNSLVIVDKATGKEYPNLKVLATYKSYLDTAVNYATRLG